MKLEILDPESLLSSDFYQWLVRQIRFEIIRKIDRRKLETWDIYFNESEDYKSITNLDIKTENIILFGAKSISPTIHPTQCTITFNKNQFVPGLDRVKVESVCKLINFGNLSIKGYPIFSDTLQYVADNINDYVKRFYTGGF